MLAGNRTMYVNSPHVRGNVIQRCCRVIASMCVCLCGLSVVASLHAQGAVTPAAQADIHDRADPAVEAAVLGRTVTLHLERATLKEALAALVERTGVQFVYSKAAVPVDRAVSLIADRISVGEALTLLLRGTGLEVTVGAAGRIRLARAKDMAHGSRGAPHAQQGGGTIQGRVVDAVTRAPLDQVAIRVEGSGLGAVTSSDGRYAIRDIPVGTYRLVARRVGYTPLTKTVMVPADSTTSSDFALVTAATKLDEVVTTAVGNQRRIELGNSITTINADSLVRTTPITQLTDVLAGRAPGVQVLQDQGQVGAGVRIRVRGLSSFTLSNDPIIYLDGVRLDGTGQEINGASPSANAVFPVPSRLNDIDPADIESIDVLKGPSAATEYGTDAASGVIVIKTKHGQAGAPRWDFHAEQGWSTVPAQYPLGWYAFGHTTDGTNTPVQCPRTYAGGPTVANGGCVIDSVTTYQPLNHASTSIFRTGDDTRGGVQVTGGTQQLQYFLGGTYNSATGVLQLPPVFRQQMLAKGTPIPSYMETPNTLDQANVRGRVTTKLGSTADVGFAAAYISNDQRSGNDLLALEGASLTTGNRNDGFGGYGEFGAFLLPTYSFMTTGSEGIRRFTGSANGTWRPTSWLNAHATVGIDNGERTDDSYQAPGADPFAFTAFPGSSGTGYHGIGRIATALYTTDIGATVTASLSTALSSKTSVGAQYNVRNQTGALSQAYGLTASGALNGASAYQASQLDSAARTVGSYVEENISWRDQLFLIGALRVDAGSGFGSQVNAAVYPKASLSWAAIQTPSHRLRLRAAFGESGVQPPSGATLSLLAPTTVSVGGRTVTGDTATTVGNAQLKPERSGELETGFDAGIFNDRVTMELTYYRKHTSNTIVANFLPGSNGGRIEYENLGSVLNYGVESNVTVQVLDTRPVGWDVTVGGALNTNRLTSLAPGEPPINAPFFPYELQYRQVVGYPIFGLWAPTLVYADANHDGIIEPTEASQITTLSYQGSSTPIREFTLNTGVSLFGRVLRISGQVDYRGGNKIQDAFRGILESIPSAAPLNDPHASLARQAPALEGAQSSQPFWNSYFEDGSFVRWREASVTYFLSDRLSRSLHVRAASITALGRNLVLWTRYPGIDPEVVTPGAIRGAPADGVYDAGATPLTRSWALRVNLGL